MTPVVIFTDDFFFYCGVNFNKQNDRVYARSSKESRQLTTRIDELQWWFGGKCPLTALFLNFSYNSSNPMIIASLVMIGDYSWRGRDREGQR